MSRADKRVHQEKVIGTSLDRNVRLFAFTNTRPGYGVVFSPEEPLIVLKTKKSATEQHPCKQWEPLSSLIFSARPNSTHAVYVADTTLFSGTPLEQEEVVNGAAVGPMMKRLSNMFAKLNPHNATLVAAGVSSLLGLKFALVGERTLGHPDRYVQRVILLCPGPIGPLRAMVDAVLRRPRDPHYPRPELVVLLNDAKQLGPWKEWLEQLQNQHSLFADCSVTSDLTPSLFAATVRAVGVKADGTMVNTTQRYDTPKVYRIDFILSKQTKSVEQVPRLSPLDTLGHDEDEEEPSGSEEEGESETGPGHQHHNHAECGSCCEFTEGTGSALVPGLTSLDYWRDPVRVVVEGRVLSIKGGLIGTTEGRVAVNGVAELVAADQALQAHIARKKKAPAVFIAAALTRDESGRTTLTALGMRPMTTAEERRSMTVGGSVAEIPRYNVSSLAKSYGALLVRGRKCALVRDLSPNPSDRLFEGLRIPRLPHSENDETAIDCAVRALCEGCEVSSDNFYRPNYLTPVAFYEPIAAADSDADGNAGAGAVRCVELFVMLAVNPPPRGAASDAVEDMPEEDEPYDWVSFHRALQLLRCAPEREALAALQAQLRRAHEAGLYVPFSGCGLFGEEVRPSDTGAVAEVSAVSLEGLEVSVVVCPGDESREALPIIQGAMPEVHIFSSLATEMHSTAALVAAAHAVAARGGNTITLYLDTTGDLSVNTFCEDHLLPLTEKCGATARLFTLLLPAAAASACRLTADTDGSRAAVLGTLMEAAQSSDVLLTLDPPERMPASTWALLVACATANPDLSFFYGPDARRPIEVTSDVCPGLVPTPASDSAPRLVRVELFCAGVPLAPAALAFMTTHDSLSALYRSDECVVVLLQGSVWVSTRPETQAFVSLDHAGRSLYVEEGEEWVGSPEESRESALTLLLWCTPTVAEAATDVAQLMFAQLKWDAKRDGEDWRTIMDPLPQWE